MPRSDIFNGEERGEVIRVSIGLKTIFNINKEDDDRIADPHFHQSCPHDNLFCDCGSKLNLMGDFHVFDLGTIRAASYCHAVSGHQISKREEGDARQEY